METVYTTNLSDEILLAWIQKGDDNALVAFIFC